jgi:hypothetical protein
MQFVAIVGLCILSSIGYGIVHDQITARLCVEYFTVFHPPVFGTDNPTLLGIGWGVLATWWVGLLLGIPLAVAARAGSRPKRSAADLLRPILWLMVVCGTVACVAGVCGFIAASNGWVWLVPQLATKIPVERHTMFLVDLWLHNASYVSGFLGGLVLIVQVWRGRRHVDGYGTVPHLRLLLVFILFATGRTGLSAETNHDLASLERSFWLHASLATQSQKGYWGPNFAASPSPAETDIRNAANLLTDKYAANRLYLVYHHELPLQDAEQVFRWWRQYCPEKVQLIPTLVLRMYDGQQTPVFTLDELRQLVTFFQQSINGEQIAVSHVYPKRDQGDALKLLAEQYPKGLIRVGIQPDERIASPFVAAVQDTWSGFCHGKTNADWLDRGFGAETLRQWVEDRNQPSHRVTWDLIVVAWDYAATERGGYPGYDDAAKNMPLPAGRNRLAADEILRTAKVDLLSGFSSDLLILRVLSASVPDCLATVC